MIGRPERKSTTWLNPLRSPLSRCKKSQFWKIWQESMERIIWSCRRRWCSPLNPTSKRIRIVACCKQTDDTFGKITTTDLDSWMLRFLLFWGASTRKNVIATLNVTAAFLNADLPPGRIVVPKPPTILYKLGLSPTGFVCRVHRAVYGLREAPSSWSLSVGPSLSKLSVRKFIGLFVFWCGKGMFWRIRQRSQPESFREFNPSTS